MDGRPVQFRKDLRGVRRSLPECLPSIPPVHAPLLYCSFFCVYISDPYVLRAKPCPPCGDHTVRLSVRRCVRVHPEAGRCLCLSRSRFDTGPTNQPGSLSPRRCLACRDLTDRCRRAARTVYCIMYCLCTISLYVRRREPE
jgi:hypothetical protein